MPDIGTVFQFRSDVCVVFYVFDPFDVCYYVSLYESYCVACLRCNAFDVFRPVHIFSDGDAEVFCCVCCFEQLYAVCINFVDGWFPSPRNSETFRHVRIKFH